MFKILSSLFLAFVLSTPVFAGEYTVQGSWVDDTIREPVYVPEYSYRVFVDGVLQVEKIVSAPQIQETFTGVAGAEISIQKQNRNAFVSPSYEGNWSAVEVLTRVTAPADVVTSTIVVVYRP